jgi:hypothetical protein
MGKGIKTPAHANLDFSRQLTESPRRRWL